MIERGNGAIDLARLALEYSCTAVGCNYPGINSRLSNYGARFDGSRITLNGDRHNVRIEIEETKKMLSIYDKMVKEFPYLKNWYASCSPYIAAMVYYLGIDTNIKNEPSNIIAATEQYKYYAKSSSFDQIPLEPNKTFAEQCQPGDILSIDYGDNGHTMIYVGNKLAQEYFPGTTGGMVESGQTNGYYPGVTTRDKQVVQSTWHCYRPKGGSNNLSNMQNSNLQGVIKFKRHDKDGNESYLTYATPTEFQNQVEIYNRTDSEEARARAKSFVMSHFTLKEKPVNGTTDIIYGTGSFTQYNLSDSQLNTLARICIREQGSAKGAAAEASLMANLFELAGGSFGSGADGLYNYVMTSGWFGIPGDHNAPGSVNNEELTAVKAVLMQGYRTLPKYVNEHDCINPPDIIDPPARREDFKQFQTVLHNIYGSTYTFYSFPTEDSDPFGYTSEANRQKYGDFCYEYGTWQPINGTEDKNSKEVKASGKKSKKSKDDSSSSDSLESSNYTGKLDKSAAGEGYPEGTYTSSAGLTYKAYKQGNPAPWAGKSYGDGSHTIGSFGCGVTSVSIILSGLGYDLTPLDVGNGMNYTTNTDYLNNMGVKAQYVNGNISASEVEKLLSEGKVIAMHYKRGTFFGGSAPYHYVAIVDADGKGNFMVLNPGGGESGWYSSDKIAQNYERVEIDVGSSTRNVSNKSTSTKDGIGYEAVIATYTEVDKELSYDGPDVEGAAEDFGISLDATPEYTISTTNVNYEALVQPYTLQFEFLWTLLVTGQSKSFVMDLAKLAYESDIEVSIYDNLTTTINTDNCTYLQVTDGRFSGSVSYGDKTRPIDKHVHKYENGNPLESPPGYITKTVTTRTDTIEYALTRANTWIADYKLSYKFNPPDSNTQTGGYDLSNHKIQPWTSVDYSDGADPCKYIDGIVNEIVSEVNAELEKEYEEKKTAYDTANKSTGNTIGDLGLPPQQEQIDASNVEKDITMETRIRRVEMHDSTVDETITQKYTEETPSAVIKDDEKTKPNFVTLFNDYKYRDNRNSILSAVEWIFEMMEENEDLANILDIFKYLLYKSTGVNYGVTELDETLFYPGKLEEVEFSDNSDIVTAAKEVHDYVQKNNYTYGAAIPPNDSKLVDCSGFVCGVLQKCGYKGFGNEGIRSTYNFFDHISGSELTGYPGWKVYDASQMQAGDILLRHGHTAIYIGDGLTYDCGATSVIQSGPVDVSWGGPWEYAIRAPQSSSGGIGFTSKQADDLIFLQQKSRGAKGNITSNKAIECGWCSLSHALILTTEDYSLTPEKIATQARKKLGNNFTNSYNLYTLQRVAKNVYNRKTAVKGSLSAKDVKDILKSKGTIIASVGAGSNVKFYKKDGSSKTHPNGHTIMFYKYENGYFYAKDSAPSTGGTRCKFPESYTKIFSGYNLVIY